MLGYDSDEKRARLSTWVERTYRDRGMPPDASGLLGRAEKEDLPDGADFLGLATDDEGIAPIGVAFTQDRLWLAWFDPTEVELTLKSFPLSPSEATSELRIGELDSTADFRGPMRKRVWRFEGRGWDFELESRAGTDIADRAEMFAAKLAAQLGWESEASKRRQGDT